MLRNWEGRKPRHYAGGRRYIYKYEGKKPVMYVNELVIKHKLTISISILLNKIEDEKIV